MKVNQISRINFRENTLSRTMSSENAILMLRDSRAAVKFKHSQEIAQKADSVETNPIVALGYKLYRTFNMLKNNDGSEVETKQLDEVV